MYLRRLPSSTMASLKAPVTSKVKARPVGYESVDDKLATGARRVTQTLPSEATTGGKTCVCMKTHL